MASACFQNAAVARLLALWCSSLMFISSVDAFGSVLMQDYTMYAEQYLVEGPYSWKMQSDCNIVLYKNNYPVWASNTANRGYNCQLRLQRDGNCVLYSDNNQALWATNTANQNNGYHYIIVQCDGNVVMYTGAGYPIWATNTGGRIAGVEVTNTGGIIATGDSTSSDSVTSTESAAHTAE